ncbi:hypothetical protein E1B28_012478 [Marasmius oreades]|uniref:Borealin N-terminal domain-containing protein n=1 Tax=Marasmius oreades TaxID=181124 RepID=A0A9P7UP04_9AGAR|nr:uncharacterized protein E1B28_012478 [Marasmius oreades]KAG7088490.1 hypothetical protein E1B28_012478 [Marasmius oreades]
MSSRPKYSDDEKKHLLANLEIEVAHRTRQLQSWLADRLEQFKLQQEGHVIRLPKQVRNMTMQEFGGKYNGSVEAAMKGLQRERLKASGSGEGIGEIDKSTRKRKWLAIQGAEEDGVDRDGDARTSKNARMMQSSSPKKQTGPSTGSGTTQQHSRFLGAKTPNKSRFLSSIPGSPSPQKPPAFKPTLNRTTSSNSTSSNIRSQVPRPLSPSKSSTGLIPNSRPPANYNPGVPRSRVPTSSTFNPALPPEAPGYPTGSLRMPRMDEKMLSINGSPLANPLWYQPSGTTDDGGGGDGGKRLKRTASNISIRRDPSFLTQPRPNSQASFATTHSRNNSEATLISPSETQAFDGLPPKTPDTRYPTMTRSYSVTISTKDGHLLEFDPLRTSPGALDALDGITDSAKKQAREEMGRLVQAAVDKWKVG